MLSLITRLSSRQNAKDGFLGVKNLTIIKDCCKLIKHNHSIEIDPDEILLDDEKHTSFFKGVKPMVFSSLNRQNARTYVH